MKIEARALRVADVVRIPGDGEREIRGLRMFSDKVQVWFRQADGSTREKP